MLIVQSTFSSEKIREKHSLAFVHFLPRASNQLARSVTAILKGLGGSYRSEIVLGHMMESRNKILGSGGTSYATYLDPLVPAFRAVMDCYSYGQVQHRVSFNVVFWHVYSHVIISIRIEVQFFYQKKIYILFKFAINSSMMSK